VQECVVELKRIIKGPEGEADKSLAATLQRAVDDLERHSTSLDALFNGTTDGSSKGLLNVVNQVGGDWNTLVTEVTYGKDEAIEQLENVSKSLALAGEAIARSESEVKKLGSASEKLGAASETVTNFVNVVKMKPNSLVWGLNREQKEKLGGGQAQEPAGSRRTLTGPGKR
jgi:hypothetical protein